MSYPKINMDAAAKLAQGLQDHLSPDETAKAISRGLNQAAVGIRAEMVKRIGTEANLKASRMKAIAPIEKSNADTLEARIVVKGESIPLVEYITNKGELDRFAMQKNSEGQKVRKPAKIKIKKKGKTTALKSGFLAPTYRNLMVRETESRAPLKTLYGPSLTSFAEKVQEEMGDVSREIVEKRIGESLSYQIKKSLGII